MNLTILAAAVANIPSTFEWTPAVGLVMVIFNIVGLFIARNAVKVRGVGPSVPIPGLGGKDFGLAQFIAGTSFGHILGTGAILGLTNAGII